ncbi:MAG: DUF222 domain-containing protein [Candidatus Dormibacteraeota bacterium]|nr:DUF222 domain-containing protein [Candidatus Dormibacteraeota bacterium]
MCDAGELRDPLADLESALARVRAVPHGGRSREQLTPDVIRLRRLIDQAELEFAVRCGELAATGEFDPEYSESAYQWIRDECKVSGRVASDALAVAEQSASLSGSVAALDEGRIGFGHLALMAHTAAALTESTTAPPIDESRLLKQAERHTVTRFRRDCTNARHAADSAAFLNDYVDAADARFLDVKARDDGSVWLRGFLDSVGAASLRTVLESLGRRDGAGDIRTSEKRMADALVELAEFALHNPDIAGGGARAPQLMVTASVDTLRNAPGAPAAELDFAGLVPAETARRLACDADIIPVAVDGEGRPLAVGRSRRMPNTATRRKLQLRDRGCVFGNCDRPASWTVPHHIVFHENGGGNDLDNLASLCNRHHWVVHEGGSQLVRTKDGRFLVLPPPSDVPRARPPTTTAA